MKFSKNGFYLKTSAICALAVFIILFGLSAFYLNIKANPEKLFTDNYRPYEPQIMRGASHRSNLKEAYTEGKMDSVIWEFKNLNSPIPEEYLLAGIAFLEKNQPEKAIETFKMLIQTNTNSKTDYFEDDAEYYLAMSYLSNQESEKAMPYFEKIKADPENRHYDDVSEWFILNVRNSIVKK
jgi:tetratricopeptide (TPR) repeat protein